MHVSKDGLQDQAPEHGLEALVSSIDNKDELIKALKAAGKRCSTIKRCLNF